MTPLFPSKSWPELLVVSPTNPYKGRALSEKERSNLIVATQFERVYLLEDDYNGGIPLSPSSGPSPTQFWQS